MQAINQSLVEIGPDLFLMIAHVIQPRTLNFDVRVHSKLLEKVLAINNGIEDSRPYLKLITVVVTHRNT
jgi:hypothetical protein